MGIVLPNRIDNNAYDMRSGYLRKNDLCHHVEHFQPSDQDVACFP
jgi:hypothetical protein